MSSEPPAADEPDAVEAPAVTPPPHQLMPTMLGNTIEVPHPMRPPAEMSEDLPPLPERMPEGVILMPGELYVKVRKLPNGAYVTTDRHYRMFVPNNAKRWSFTLLYAKGVEVHDRNLVKKIEEVQTVDALSTVVAGA